MSQSAKHSLRVLVVNPDYYRSSGVTVAIRRLYEASSPSDVSYQFVSCLMPHTSATKAEDLDWITSGEVQRLDLMSRNPVRLLRALIGLRHLLKSTKIDVLHIHHRRLAILCGWVAHLTGVATVYTGHLVYGRNIAFHLAHIDGAVAITKTIANEIAEDHSEAEVRVISNIALNNAHQVDAVGGRVTCVARLDPVKNHETLLRAWAKMGPQQNVVLQLLGEGNLRSELESLAAELQITDTVEFCGFVSDAPLRIARSSFLVLSSYVEGQPMAVIEGAMSGRPSLVSDVPGSRDAVPSELLLPNLFDPNDPDELASLLKTWLSQPEQVRKEGQNFRAYAEAIASPEVVAFAHVALYRHVSGG